MSRNGRMQEGYTSPRNSKRVAAEDSVCIKKSPPKPPESSNLSVVSNVAAHGGDLGDIAQVPTQPSIRLWPGESAKWFDDSNKNVSSKGGAQFYADNDPPFFLKNKSSSDDSLPNPYKAPPSTNAHLARRVPHAASLLSRNQITESSSEDFRSVIDDLTIENRKLRKKLRKYEQVHCGELQGEKLFELRVHGLPASKKRKLEKALQEFAASLNDTPDDDDPSVFAQKLAKVPARKADLQHNASSTGTSNSRTLADSAYASMSSSSNTKNTRPEHALRSEELQANDQAVRSYLHTLARGMLPKHPPVLTEKTKKQVVVRRLEQLFVGSNDHTGKESQSKQQQELSQIAASADRRTNEAQGRGPITEGRRESKIFATEEELKEGVKLASLERLDSDSSEATASSGATPDQRPTRPLDLDPSRAQVPAENIEYMKHLGFNSPQTQAEANLTEDENWIYLNLLTSMAQLHILNVTPEFVRGAIREYSTQFELSSDGSRIRWKGGKRPTLLTSDSGEISAHGSSSSFDLPISHAEVSGASRSLENQSGSGSGNNRSSSHNNQPSNFNKFDRHRPMLLGQTTSGDAHQYRPIFYHDNNSDDSGRRSYEDKGSSLSSGPMDSTMLNPDGTKDRKMSQSKLRQAADPIIFYSKAKFYTDLSKDDESMPYNCPLYNKNIKSIVGVEEVSEDSDEAEDKGPLSKALSKMTFTPDRKESYPSLQGFTEASPSDSSTNKLQTSPMTFEVSGLGGVVPGDNFSINVEVGLERPSPSKKITTKILSSKLTELLPSSLPPPSYAYLPFSSSDDNDEDSESDEDIDMDDVDAYEQDLQAYVPPKFLNSFSSSGSNEDQDDDDMSDDSSIDMLAHAREIEPETVAAAEREFDDNISSIEEDDKMDIAPPTASSVVATLGDQSFDRDETTDKALPASVGVPATTATISSSSPTKVSPSTTRKAARKSQGKSKQRRTKV